MDTGAREKKKERIKKILAKWDRFPCHVGEVFKLRILK